MFKLYHCTTQKLERTQVPVNGRVAKYSRTLNSSENELSTTTNKKIDELHKH